MAGTTVRDFDNVHEAIQEALSNQDIHVTRDEVNAVMGLPKPIAIESLLKNEMNHEEVTPELIGTVYDDFVNIMVDFYQHDPLVQAEEGAERVFSMLHEHGIKVALDTGFSRKIADTIIHRLGWLDKELIDYSVTSDEVDQGRPFPDMIFAIMKALQIKNVHEVAKVGDTSSDIAEGNAAGCKYIIGITSGAYSRAQLMNTKHTHLIDTLDDLLPILGLSQ